jgi:hypothetical protein
MVVGGVVDNATKKISKGVGVVKEATVDNAVSIIEGILNSVKETIKSPQKKSEGNVTTEVNIQIQENHGPQDTRVTENTTRMQKSIEDQNEIRLDTNAQTPGNSTIAQ